MSWHTRRQVRSERPYSWRSPRSQITITIHSNLIGSGDQCEWYLLSSQWHDTSVWYDIPDFKSTVEDHIVDASQDHESLSHSHPNWSVQGIIVNCTIWQVNYTIVTYFDTPSNFTSGWTPVPPPAAPGHPSIVAAAPQSQPGRPTDRENSVLCSSFGMRKGVMWCGQ